VPEIKLTKSYLSIIDTALLLFEKFGIRKVSVEEICRTAEVSKMTFYRSFKNKQELILRVINHFNKVNLDQYTSIMEEDIPFPDKIKNLVAAKHNANKLYSQEFISDLLNTKDLQIQELIEVQKHKGMELFKKDLIQAQKDGWIKKEFSIEFIMYYLETIQQKLVDQRLFNLFRSTEELSDSLTNLFFYGIVSPERLDEV
jgi:AcrR family transcriptional regulator